MDASVQPVSYTHLDVYKRQGYTGFAYVLDVAHHLILPVVTLAILYIAQYSRMERASMIDILGTDYIRTARAKGLRERTVVYKHALKNALIPVVTLAGMQFSQVFAGAVLVETVFNWPGMGRLAYESILRKDYPTLLGILFCSVFVVIIANVQMCIRDSHRALRRVRPDRNLYLRA